MSSEQIERMIAIIDDRLACVEFGSVKHCELLDAKCVYVGMLNDAAHREILADVLKVGE